MLTNKYLIAFGQKRERDNNNFVPISAIQVTS